MQKVLNTRREVERRMQQFYESEHYTHAQSVETACQLITIIDQLLVIPDWESSFFLRHSIKSIRQLREDLQSKLDQGVVANAPEDKSLPEGESLIYILLYQAKGHDLKQWVQQLKNISHYTQGRPVYAHEEHVIKAINSKLEQSNEAYAVVKVARSDVEACLVSNRQDKWGNPLLSLPSNAIKEQDIIALVHLNQNYCYQEGKLLPIIAKTDE